MNTEVFPFSGFHPLAENATRRPVPRSPRHAALLILAGISLLCLRALPGADDHSTGRRIQLPFLG